MTSFLKRGDNVVIIESAKKNDDLKEFVEKVKHVTGSADDPTVVSNLKNANFGASSTDVVLSFADDCDQATEILRILRPGGKLVIYEKPGFDESERYKSKLRLSGFAIQENMNKLIFLSMNDQLLQAKDKNCEIVAEKPAFEIGSSLPLNFSKPAATNVWKIDDAIEDDLIDEDDLLSENDVNKPDAASLRVCGTTGKRKACKDCSCGLAEELNGETAQNKTANSSCGNCYLGDAFRCASCPYLGMPAFKPGEKVTLPETQLAPEH